MIAMVFDVESVGLYGEGFAVGWVVITDKGVELESGLCYAPIDTAAGRGADRRWVETHVIPALKNTSPQTPETEVFQLSCPVAVRHHVWAKWLHWRGVGARLAADVPFPVEATFLKACVDDAPHSRGDQGPYPLIDIASMRFSVGMDPASTEERREGEFPAHNPLADARQSARLMLECLTLGESFDAVLRAKA
jgi:hypothetical protein